MDCIGGCMDDEVIRRRNLCQAAKRAAKQGSQMPDICPRRRLFKQMAVLPTDQPYFEGHARGVRTKSQIITLRINDAPALPLLLTKDVAEHASFFFFEPRHRGAKLIENTEGHKTGCGDMRIRMFP